MKTCFEQLNTEKSCRAIVLTGSGRAFSTGIDVKYLSLSVAGELTEIDDIGRKALHVRKMILRTQESLRSVDKVKIFYFVFNCKSIRMFSVRNLLLLLFMVIVSVLVLIYQLAVIFDTVRVIPNFRLK